MQKFLLALMVIGLFITSNSHISFAQRTSRDNTDSNKEVVKERKSDRKADRKGKRKADERLTPEKRANHIVNRLTEKLQLTEDQKTQVYQVQLETFQKLEEWKKDLRASGKSNFDRKAFQAKRKALKKETKRKVKALLTPQQLELYKEMKKENRERKGKGKLKNKDKNNRGDRRAERKIKRERQTDNID